MLKRIDKRKNRNRGYRKLIVWQDAIELYREIYLIFSKFPYELRKIIAQQPGSVDGVHRNIAEGYCRRSVKEYLQFLNIAISSLGESVSGLHSDSRTFFIESFITVLLPLAISDRCFSS